MTLRSAIHASLLAVVSLPAAAQSLDGIRNYREHSATFSSAGQPTEAELAAIRDAGFERIVYIAFSTDRDAIANEDRLVRDLGMEYVQIPVIFDEPTVADFESFAAVMERDPGKRTLLHCQVNMRASVFAFLYRVLHDGVPMVEARAELNTVWEPNETWRRLIFDVLEARGVTADCEGCDWAE